MSYSFFHNLRHAKRKLSEAYLSIQAVDKKLKPAYLWDAFSADITEIDSYLQHLYTNHFTDHRLDAFRVDDSVLVAHCDTLKRHVETLSASNMTLINVSENVETPALLSFKEKTEALRPIFQRSQEIVSHLCAHNNTVQENIDYTVCNLSTLFGLLLGYPVLYWFSQQTQDSHFSCLSMTPLKVYKIVSSVCLPSNSEKHALISKKVPLDHQLFSFSIPDVISKQTERNVRDWFSLLTDRNLSNSLFGHLKIETDIVSLPSVSL